MAGFVMLPRSIQDDVVFSTPDMWHLFSWCLFRASYSTRWVAVKTGRGMTQVELHPGQFIFGRDAAAKALGVAPSTIYDRMRRLQAVGNVTMQPGTHFSIVTVCDWSRYAGESANGQQATRQPTRHPTDRQPTPIRHPSGAKKKEEKEEKGDTVETVLDDHGRISGGMQGGNGWPADFELAICEWYGHRFRWPGPGCPFAPFRSLASDDRDLVAKLHVLAEDGQLAEARVISMIEAVRRHGGPVENGFGYIQAVLAEELGSADELHALLAGVTLPLREAAPCS